MFVFSAVPAFGASYLGTVDFSDTTHGYLGGWYGNNPRSGFMSASNDGGATWHATPTGQSSPISLAVNGLSSARAASYYDDMVLSTDNTGTTWSRNTPIVGASTSFSDIAMSSIGYVAAGKRDNTSDGDVGLIYASADGISGWTRRFEGPLYPDTFDPISGDVIPGADSNAEMDAVAFAPDGMTGWAVGSEFSTVADAVPLKRLLIYKTSNGGSTWTTQTASGVTSRMRDIVVTDPTHAYAIGTAGRTVLQTTNGSTWSAVTQSPIPPNRPVTLYGIDAYGTSLITAVGKSLGGKVAIQSSTDGGATWSFKEGPVAGQYGSISMITATKWIVVGDGETIGRTSDGGATWTWTTATPPKVSLTSPVTYDSASPTTRLVAGTSSDVGAGVASVDVSILRDDGKYWNPDIGWVAAPPFWNPASTVNGWDTWAWNWAPDLTQVGSHSYDVFARATDAVGQSTTSLSYTITPSAGANGTISPSTLQLVIGGADKTFTVVPAPGHQVANVIKNGVSIGASESVTFTNVTSNQTISATFAVKTYTIMPTAGPNGVISPSIAQTVDHGANKTFTITPSTGYHVADVLIDGVSVGAVASYAFAAVTATHTISATFAINIYTITPTAGPNGTVSPATQQTVDYGASKTFSISPATGYQIADVLVDGLSVGAVASYTFTNVTATHTLSATFVVKPAGTFTVTPTAGLHGTIWPGDQRTVTSGDGVTFTITAALGYHISDVTTDGVSIGASSTVTFVNVTADHTIGATFAIDTHTLTYTAGSGGSIDGSAIQVVDYGANGTAVTASPTAGYRFKQWSDGSAINPRTDANVQADLAVAAIFEVATRPVVRLSGNDRYATAAALARKGWDPNGTRAWAGVKHIVIANGEPGKEADPVTAAGLAGLYESPVLTVQIARVPSATKNIITEIALKNPGVRIHIVGSTAVVPDARWNDIKKIPGVSQVKDRVAGRDRYETSAAIANRIVSIEGTGAIQGFILIAADNPAAFYDALAASPVAYAQKMPMLSVKKKSIPRSVARVLGSADLKTKPRYAASSATYIGSVPAAGATRLTTSWNRYTAATQIAVYATAPARMWTSLQDTALAATLPDALTGGAFLGRVGGVMLFTDSSSAIQSTSKAFIKTNKLSISDGWVIGGTPVVPAAQETSFRNLLNP